MAAGRDALTDRVLPQMALSDGSAASMTGAPSPISHHLSATARVAARFEVHGNAISMSCFITSFGTNHRSSIIKPNPLLNEYPQLREEQAHWPSKQPGPC